jgi:hypothetical protein
MGTTDKYDFDTTNYGTTGWNALLASALEKADVFIHTYLRYKVAPGASLDQYDPVHLVDQEWQLALANGINQPAYGIAVEGGTSGEYLRAQHAGPVTNPAWSFSGSGEVYLGASGELTQVVPATNVNILGYSIASDTILIFPFRSLAVDSGDSLSTADIVTTVGSPGSDAKIPSEQAVREALSAISLSGYVSGELVTTVGTPGSDTKVPSEQAIREEFSKYPTSGEFVLKTDIGTGPNQVVTLDGSSKLPAVDGSQLTNVTSSAASHNPSVLGDHGYTCSLAYLPVKSGENAGFGTVLCFSGENLVKSQAANANRMPILFMALQNVSGEQNVIMPPGFIRDDSWSWTPGNIIYASLVSGEITQTKPTATGHQVQFVGKAISSKKIFFNPSPIVIEIV